MNSEKGGQTSKIANERLEDLLGYGKFQMFQIWIFLGYVSFLGSVDYFHVNFLVMKQDHRCGLPEEIELR